MKKNMHAAKLLKQLPENDKLHFYYKLCIENEMDNFFINRKKKAGTNHLQQKSDSLDLFFIANKLEYWCDMLNRSNVLNIDYDYPLMEEIIRLIHSDKEKYLSISAIKNYYFILLTLKEPENEIHFFQLKKNLSADSSAIAENEEKVLFDYAQNYCIKRINKGDSLFLEELLFLYKEMIHRELIYESGFFPASDFKNVITIACRTKSFDWAEDFIFQYKEKLEPGIREHVFQYNLASLYYEKGDYDKALELLNKVEFTDIYFALGGRSMLMKIYFELNEHDALNWHLDAFINYLRRNKLVSKYQYSVHINFIRFTRKAFQLKSDTEWKSKKELEKASKKLIEMINQTKEITNKAWLEKQLKKIMKED
ncbi:MAG: hypothetical protein EA412_06580 [Chitinophagaceae bacterium]|nr:MAG: hypothetical protein EA412_06580 [Chitinophagaceae bacterium]